MQVLRSHSWQWVQEVHGEDAGTHVPLCDLKHPTKTDRWWRKAQQCQDYNFLSHKNSRYLFNSWNIWICLEMYSMSNTSSFSPWIPKDRLFSPATQVLQQPPEHKTSPNLIWRRVSLVPSHTSLIQVQNHFLISLPYWNTVSLYRWISDVCFLLFILKVNWSRLERPKKTRQETSHWSLSARIRKTTNSIKSKQGTCKNLSRCGFISQTNLLSPHHSLMDVSVCYFRGDRRAKQLEDRKQKKESILGARRGLVMM